MRTKEVSHSAKIRKGLYSELCNKIDLAKATIKEKKVAKAHIH